MSDHLRVALVCNYAATIPEFRGALIRALRDSGCEIFVLAPDWNETSRAHVEALGASCVSYRLVRASVDPAADLDALRSLVLALRRLRPTLVFAFMLKPIVLAAAACRIVGCSRFVAMVEGLGWTFTEGGAGRTIGRRMLQKTVQTALRLALRQAEAVFTLNADDTAFVERLGVSKSRLTLLPSIGIDLLQWRPAPPYLTPMTFTFVGRVLREKGILEFVEAAKRVRYRHPEIRFRSIGPLDSNPGAIREAAVRGWVEEGVLEWVPWTEDISLFLRETSVFVLPSYREGKPRSTQEAMAMARPVITTDVPGCRETVVDGINGFLVPPRDPEALAKAMMRFIEEPELIGRMGRESRRIAEERFDVRRVNARILEVLGLP
jgi:glycosyltransferase involved in cell wall biosynthesis